MFEIGNFGSVVVHSPSPSFVIALPLISLTSAVTLAISPRRQTGKLSHRLRRIPIYRVEVSRFGPRFLIRVFEVWREIQINSSILLGNKQCSVMLDWKHQPRVFLFQTQATSPARTPNCLPHSLPRPSLPRSITRKVFSRASIILQGGRAAASARRCAGHH